MEQLPWIVQKRILQMLSLSDLTNLSKVSKHFAHLITSEYKSWITTAPITSLTTQSQTIHCLQRFSSQGNIEAMIKLAVLLPYQDGFITTEAGSTDCAVAAAEMFCHLEASSVLKHPLTWMLLRRPWSDATTCRKARVYNHMSKLLPSHLNHGNMCYCIGKIILLQVEPKATAAAKFWIRRGFNLGSVDAEFQLWKWKVTDSTEIDARSLQKSFSSLEPGTRLCFIRELRSIAAKEYFPAQIQLCRLYAMGHCDGVTTAQSHFTVKNFFLKSSALRDKPFSAIQSEITAYMRFVLVDWLIEVATSRAFNSATLHAAVQILDRYLAMRCPTREYFQLVGIACFVISTRAMEEDILTIREAVWFTDSSYKYNELVSTISDIVAALGGNIQKTTVIDYLEILLMMPNICERTKSISRFLADCTILYADVGLICPSLTACCCLLLANLVVDADSSAWSEEMEDVTGYTVLDLRSTTLKLHDNCISVTVLRRPDDVPMNALEEMYEHCKYGPITRSQIVDYDRVVEFFDKYEVCTNNMETVYEQSILAGSHYTPGVLLFAIACAEAHGGSPIPDFEGDENTPSFTCSCARQTGNTSRKRIHADEDHSRNVFSCREKGACSNSGHLVQYSGNRILGATENLRMSSRASEDRLYGGSGGSRHNHK